MKLNTRNLIIALAVAALITPSAFALSLALKKEKANSEKKIAEISMQIEKDCGCKPNVDVDWDSLPTKEDFRIPGSMLSNAADGMQRVCKQFKKEVCDGIKTIKISMKKPMDKSLKDGVLDLSSDASNKSWGAQQIQKLIEDNL